MGHSVNIPDMSNADIERFNRTYRTAVLNAHRVESVAELRALPDASSEAKTATAAPTRTAEAVPISVEIDWPSFA